MTKLEPITIDRAIVIKIYLLLISLMALTFLRPLLFLSLPISVFIFCGLFNTRSTIAVLVIFLAMIMSTIVGSLYVKEFNISNNILSLYFLIPITIIFFSSPKVKDHGYLGIFIKMMTWILLANNIVAFFQFIRTPSDDSFIGFYGTHGLALHTLSLVNYMMSVFYFFSYQRSEKRIHLWLAIFFLISGLMCFYGLGLIIFLVSIFIFKFSIRAFFKSIFIFVLMMVLLGGSLYLFRRDTFLYNVENIRRAVSFLKSESASASEIPRKLVLYKNYFTAYGTDPVLFLFGSSPGTFNSRSYFLLNGEYSRSESLENTLGIHHPKLATEYVHPLWNLKNTFMYMDGTRNEPFSSFIAVLSEYGFLVFIIVWIYVYKKYKSTIRRAKASNFFFESDYFKFISIFIVLNLFTDNFLEYPEIMMIYLFLFKLIEMAINTKQTLKA